MNLNYNESNYHNLIEKINKAFIGGAFNKNFIDFITFPQYKNLEPNSTLNFSFPFTALVGKNGYGKSSVLHALYGCPKGYSTGNFWFSTNLDPIIESGGNPNCYFYQYEENNIKKVVLKTRVKRSSSKTHREDPDYWEPSRPLKKYGLDPKQRFAPINKNVVYMDFRSELSAFDQYFYFGTLSKHLSSATKQDYLRIQSNKLKSAIDSGKILKSHYVTQNEKVKNLNTEELEVISYILGKNYNSGKIIKHKLFGDWGTSVLFEQQSLKYSEAHAGSGEIAVVKLVHELLNTKERSLILLDEPEVSLHPGAQKRLKVFLLELLLEKKHQIVISTHSPNFVEGLPKESIKLFTDSTKKSKIRILENCYPTEAFYTLGQPTTEHINIIVEDNLAKSILSRIISTLGEERASHFHVTFYPGGAQTIKKDLIKHYSAIASTKTFVFFDGDQKPQCEVLNLKNIRRGDYNINYLKQHIKDITGINNIDFYTDGNGDSGGREDQLLEAQQKYINYYKNNVFYLPLNTPEELIWNETFILSYIQDERIIEQIQNTNDYKEKIHIASTEIFPDLPNSVHSLEAFLLNIWTQEKNTNMQEILDKLLRLLEITNQTSLAVALQS